jgi:glutamate-1-semialdehyde 2,1-aminomutase
VAADPGLVASARAITQRELARYSARTVASQAATERARKVLPLGVPSSFQAYDPHPIVVRHAAGSRMVDVDGNEYVDYDMGFGALFAGHMNPAVRRAVTAQLDDGTLFVTPCELNAAVAEQLADRYRLPMWRFTNSGTEATMDAIRIAKAATGRDKIVKVEGGYHGHHDDVMISMKPPIEDAGPPDAPISLAWPATSSSTPWSCRTTTPTPWLECSPAATSPASSSSR